MKLRKYTIDGDTIGFIVRDTLRDDLKFIRQDMKSGRLHPDDMENSKRYVEAIKTLQEYYGK